MVDIIGAHRSALRQFDHRVQAVRPAHWAAPTPDTGWDVTALVTHVVTEQLWVPPLLAGRELDDAGDPTPDPDALALAWVTARTAVSDAVSRVDLDATVHLSAGDTTARDYLEQLTLDLVVHGWDLARAIGVDDEFPNDLVAFVLELAKHQVPAAAGSGIFAAPIPVPGCTDDLTELLALTGRHRWWTKHDGHQ